MKKRYFKILALGTAVLLLFTGCGGSESGTTEPSNMETTADAGTETQQTESTEEAEGLKDKEDISEPVVVTDYPKLDEIDYYFKDSIVYDEPMAIFAYKNNSDYTIVRFFAEFQMKEDISTEQMSVFDTLKEKKELTDEDILGFEPHIYDYKVCDPGEEVSGGIGYLSYNLEPVLATQCEYMDLKSADISFIAEDNKIHTVRYSAVNGAYVLNEEAEELYVWSESPYASMVPKPDTRILEIDYDKEDYFQCSAYDMSMDDFKAYIMKSQEAGFAIVEDNSTSYWAKNEQGYMLHVLYRSHMNMVEITLELDE